jgi:hypothetical protein
MINYNVTNPMDSFFNTVQGMQTIQQNQNALQQQVQQLEEAKRQQRLQQQEDEFIQQYQTAYDNNDFSQIGDLLGRNIQLSDTIRKRGYEQMGLNTKEKQDRFNKEAFEIVSNPEQASSIIQQRIADKQALGEDITQEEQALQMYQQDPDAFIKNVGATLAYTAPEQYKKYLDNVNYGKMNEYQTASIDNQRQQLSDNRDYRNQQLAIQQKQVEVQRDNMNQKLEQAKLKAEQAGQPQPLKVSDRTSLIKNRQDIEKPARKAQQSVKKIEQLVNNPNATGQEATAAIVEFAKSFDPDSVVTEGEQVMYTGGNGFVADLISQANKVTGNTKLTPAVKDGLIRGAKVAANGQIELANQTLDQTQNAYDASLTADDSKKIFSDNRLKGFDIETAPSVTNENSLFRAAPTAAERETQARMAQATNNPNAKVDSVMAKYGY